MEYKLTVSFGAVYLFQTTISGYRLKQMIDLFKKKFPKKEGYELSLHRWETVGYPVKIK